MIENFRLEIAVRGKGTSKQLQSTRYADKPINKVPFSPRVMRSGILIGLICKVFLMSDLGRGISSHFSDRNVNSLVNIQVLSFYLFFTKIRLNFMASKIEPSLFVPSSSHMILVTENLIGLCRSVDLQLNRISSKNMI